MLLVYPFHKKNINNYTMEIEKRKKKRVTKEDEEKEENSGVPTEEEVEEFYTILKRMKVAVKYFDDKGKAGRDWRKTLEKPAELAVSYGGENIAAVKSGGEVLTINHGFDLNAVAPEAAEDGGA
ncbi:hypothetical protein RYX36_008042 [Vicia faba]